MDVVEDAVNTSGIDMRGMQILGECSCEAHLISTGKGCVSFLLHTTSFYSNESSGRGRVLSRFGGVKKNAAFRAHNGSSYNYFYDGSGNIFFNAYSHRADSGNDAYIASCCYKPNGNFAGNDLNQLSCRKSYYARKWQYHCGSSARMS